MLGDICERLSRLEITAEGFFIDGERINQIRARPVGPWHQLELRINEDPFRYLSDPEKLKLYFEPKDGEPVPHLAVYFGQSRKAGM